MDHKLPVTIVTPQQVQLLRIEAEGLRDSLHDQSRSGQIAGVAASSELLSLLGEGELTVAVLETVIARLAALQQQPIIHIALPALPQTELRQRIAAWCRDNLAPEVLVQFELNRNLVGGFAVRAGGSVFDFSFRRKLLDGTPKMKQVLKRV